MRPVLIALLVSCAGPGKDPVSDTDPVADTDTVASTGALPGLAADRAIMALPDQPVPAPSEDPADWELEGPVAMSRTRFMAVLADEASVGDVNTLLTAHDITIVGGDPVGGYLVGEVPDGGDLEAALIAMDDDPAFVAVQPDVGLDSLILPDDPGGLRVDYRSTSCADSFLEWSWETPTGGAAWAWKRTGVPFVWNLFDDLYGSVSGPAVGIFEPGFARGHADLSMSTDTPAAPDGADLEHGTGVASVIAADFDGDGVTGVFPHSVDLPIELRGRLRAGSFFLSASETAEFDAIVKLLRTTDTRLVNFSAGNHFTLDGGTDRPDTALYLYGGWGGTYAQLADQRGTVWHTVLERIAADVRDDFLVFCSAGNDGVQGDYTFQARDTSGCTNAAARLGSPRLLAVENLQEEGYSLHSSSNRGGTLAAPGACIGMAHPDGYAVELGTSFAAPFALGAAALVWTLDDELTALEVRSILEAGGEPAAGGSARRLNVWDAVRELDRVRDDDAWILEALDVDDGSIDGALREEPDNGVVRTPPNSRGDGCIDMSDVRALRDAILIAADTDTGALNGGASHMARDLNGDGHLSGTVGQPTGIAQSEGLWSRFDMNADQKVDITDLGWMSDHWLTCTDPALTARHEGRSAEDLYRLDAAGDAISGVLDTFDVWVPVSIVDDTIIRVHGAPVVWVDPDDTSELHRAPDDTWYAVVTAPVPCATEFPQVCTRVMDSSTDEVGPLRCALIDPIPLAGADVVVDPRFEQPADLGSLAFFSENDILWSPSLPFAGTSMRVFNGTSIDEEKLDLDDLEFNAGGTWLSPDGRWALAVSCPDWEEFLVPWSCLRAIELSDHSSITLSPTSSSSSLEILGWSDDGRQLLVEEVPAQAWDAFVYWSLNLDDLDACAGCDADALMTRLDPLERDIGGGPHDIGDQGMLLFDDAQGSVGQLRPGSVMSGGMCFPEEPGPWVTLAEPWRLLAAVPSALSADERLLAWATDGAVYKVGIVDRVGTVDELATGYTAIPHDVVAWGPAGRSLVIREPGGKIVHQSVFPDGSRSVMHVLADDASYAEARVSFSPNGSYIAAYTPRWGGAEGEVQIFGTLLGSPMAATSTLNSLGHPQWSNSGESFAYVTLRTDDEREDADVWVMDSSSGAITYLTDAFVSVVCEEDPECPHSAQFEPRWGRNMISR